MLKKVNFFNNNFLNLSIYKKNLKKTKNTFKCLVEDFEKNQIPLLDSFTKSYEFDFSLKTIKKFSKYKNIIIIGMGGSILGSKAIYSFLKKKIKKEVFFFDNLDLNLNLNYNKLKSLKNSCFLLIGKSGNTIESILNLAAIFSKSLLRNKLIVISQHEDNSLVEIANKYQADLIEHKEFISGRYSVLSETGMFPAALMGLDVVKFKNLKNLIKNRNFVSTLIHNVACIYTLNLKKINNSVILNYDSNLNDLGYWYQQLVAESLGKSSKGILPIISTVPRDNHSLMQLYLDGFKKNFFTFFYVHDRNSKKINNKAIFNSHKYLKNKNISNIIYCQKKATENIFKIKNIPFRSFEIYKRDEKTLGELFTFFILETILLGKALNLNPYDQPAVELIKKETKKLLV